MCPSTLPSRRLAIIAQYSVLVQLVRLLDRISDRRSRLAPSRETARLLRRTFPQGVLVMFARLLHRVGELLTVLEELTLKMRSLNPA